MISKFEILGLPKMTNGLMVHWRVKHTESKKWKKLVSEQCLIHGLTKLGLTSAALCFVRHSTREPDFDGLVSGFKHVLDGLVEAGVLVNDKPSVIGQPRYHWVYAKPKHGKIEIQIEFEPNKKGDVA